MKTKFLFAALAAAAMTACSTDEVVDVNRGNAISFRTSIDRAVTRTTVYSSSSLMEKFKVTAIGNSATYFDGLEVNKKTADGTTTWETASTYYWPSYSLSFYAYAPTDINSTSSATVNVTKDAQTITGFIPATTVASQQDLVVATNASVTPPSGNTITSVNLNFKHALSQIDVQAKCASENVTVKVLGVKFVNIGTKATLTFSSTTDGNGTWSATSGTAAYMSGVSSTDDVVTLGSTAKSIMATDEHFLMIPQTLTAATSLSSASQTGAYLSVLCQILVKQGSDNECKAFFPSTTDTNKYAFAAVPLSGTWEAGKKYTYTLNFGDGSSSYGGGCGVIDPTQSIPTGYSIPDGLSVDDSDSVKNNAGNNVLGKAISFTVDVANWDTEGTSVDTNM